MFPCPSCGFLVFTEPAGSCDICPVCIWEDDPVQCRFPGLGGGSNGDSLYAYQQKILPQIPVGVMEYLGYQRDPNWQPLTEAECQTTPPGLY